MTWKSLSWLAPLTTLHVPADEMGRLCAQAILARLDSSVPLESVQLETRLVQRSSTASPPPRSVEKLFPTTSATGPGIGHWLGGAPEHRATALLKTHPDTDNPVLNGLELIGLMYVTDGDKAAVQR
jgi:substrate-binding family protein